LPWALAGGVGALVLGVLVLGPRFREEHVRPETATGPARSVEKVQPARPTSPPPRAEPPAPEQAAPAAAQSPGAATPNAEPPRRASTRTPAKPGRESAAQQAGTGRLTLVTEPWSQVSLGGKQLGTTPLVNVALPAGRHTLTLRNPNNGQQKTLVIEIAPGQTLQRRVVLGSSDGEGTP
jgi:serine/threonine-protein kinase